MAVRPRYQRAFLVWLERHAALLPVRVIVRKRSNKSLQFVFEGWGNALQGYLTRHALSIGAFLEDGDWFDLVLDIDADPERVPGGYVCRLCEPDARKLFPTREALWGDHFFDGLHCWLTTKLTPASCLLFYRTPGGSTRGELQASDDPLHDRECLVASFTPISIDDADPDAGGYTYYQSMKIDG